MATRARSLPGTRAPPKLAVTSRLPKLPGVRVIRPSVWSVSGRLTYLMAPPMVFLP